MKDYLLDIVKHTVPLGAFKILRVDGTDKETTISATEEERIVVLRARTHAPIEEFKGTFGIPDVGMLNTLLSIPEYTDEGTKCLVEMKSDQPSTVHFENPTGDFKNSFRLMSKNVIEDQEKLLDLKVKSWPVEFVPLIANQQRLKYQETANPEEKAVVLRLENGEIKATVGDLKSHSGNFIFQSGIDPKVKMTVLLPIKQINGILSLSGDKTIRIGDLGMMISVDSGLANYDYIIPMLSK